MKMVRQDREKGLTKDWGVFLGEEKKYSINKDDNIYRLAMKGAD
jgi:hypothetical protein